MKIVKSAPAPAAATNKPVVRRVSATVTSIAPEPQPTAEVTELPAPEVLVTVPKAFKLLDDDHKPHVYPEGTYNMLLEHAEHWYAVANGVKRANTTRPT